MGNSNCRQGGFVVDVGQTRFGRERAAALASVNATVDRLAFRGGTRGPRSCRDERAYLWLGEDELGPRSAATTAVPSALGERLATRAAAARRDDVERFG